MDKFFGKRLKDARKRVELSQQEAADRIGIAKVSIGNYENNRREPKYEVIRLLANLYDVDINWLISGQQPQYAFKDTTALLTAVGIEPYLQEINEM